MNSFIILACALATATAHYTQLYHGPQHIPVIGKNGVPEDTVEVQHARAAHLAQVAAAKSYGYGYSTYAHEAPIASHDEQYVVQAYHGPQHFPVIGKNGVPVDTIEVQHARAEHFLHKSHAEARDADEKYSQDDSSFSYVDYEHEAQDSQAQSYGYSNYAIHAPVLSYNEEYGKQHVPVIIKGVPLDTAEVQHARAAHLAAHAAAAHRYKY